MKPYISEFDSIGHYKYALLPGGFTDYDEIRQRTDYGFAADRQVDAIELYKSGKVEKLVITGDGASGEEGNAEVYLEQLEKVWGVSRKDVIIEPKALNTFQNIDYSLKLVPDMRSENTIVINSAHLHAQNAAELSETEFPPGILCYRREHFKKMDMAVVDSGLPRDGRLDAADTRRNRNDCV